MTQREQIEALREEIAELRKELSAMSATVVELAARQPVQAVQCVPYYVPPLPLPLTPSSPWWQPPFSTTVSSGTLQGVPYQNAGDNIGGQAA